MGFRPGWKLTLFYGLLLPLLLAAGFWQLQRAREKADILALIEERREAPALSFIKLSERDDPAYRQVLLQGQFLQGRGVLLDNRTFQGRVGYEWLQPFRDDSENLVLVSRGWLAGSADRRLLPTPPPLAGPRSLRAEVYVPLGEAFVLARETLPEGWPKRVQVVDVAAIGDALGEELYPYVLRMSPAQPGALIGYWQDVNLLPEKHTAYAVQWFAMALVLSLLYLGVGFGIIRPGAPDRAATEE